HHPGRVPEVFAEFVLAHEERQQQNVERDESASRIGCVGITKPLEVQPMSDHHKQGKDTGTDMLSQGAVRGTKVKGRDGEKNPGTGKLLTDGLELYDTVAEALRLTHLGCLQHCRTYYHKAAKVTELPSGRNLARVAIEDYIGKVYAVERQIKELRERTGGTLPLQTVLKIRQERSAPLLAAFKDWVDKLLPGVPPASALGKARSYTVNQWPKLVRYLEHPEASVGRVGNWRDKHVLRGVAVVRQSRCLNPRDVSRFQSPL